MLTEKELLNNVDSVIGDIKKCIDSVGLTGDSCEFQIVTELFLYKFLNDKFRYIVKKTNKIFNNFHDFDSKLQTLSKEEIERIHLKLGAQAAKIYPNQTISYLFNHQNDTFKSGATFADFFDSVLLSISANNSDIFGIKASTQNDSTSKIELFEGVCKWVHDAPKRVEFAKKVISVLANSYNFEPVFEEKYDFFSTVFEHLIADYNINGGGTYAEYYTPKSIANIISNILVNKPMRNVQCYDPTAGSGTLLLSLAHKVGEDKCTIYSQDKTQKSVKLLRLNLILNNLVHSLGNIHHAEILREPACKVNDNLQTFDLIISNPPFKLDFSDIQPYCLEDKYKRRLPNGNEFKRFFAGVPNIPKTDKKSMPIYLLVLQHIVYSLKDKGMAAVVVPTKFLDWAANPVAKIIRQYLIDNKYLRAAISMPPNVFANTNTRVSVIFIDTSKVNNKVLLMNAESVGRSESIKVNNKKIKKTILELEHQKYIINTVNKLKTIDGVSVVKSPKDIADKNYSFVAGQYFKIKKECAQLTPKEFDKKIKLINSEINDLFDELNKITPYILGKK